MRCYFIRDGQIDAVKELPGLSDQEAIGAARTIFEEIGESCDSVEVWDCTRKVYRHGRPPRQRKKR
jgi:hypothetical protein